MAKMLPRVLINFFSHILIIHNTFYMLSIKHIHVSVWAVCVNVRFG